MSIDWKALVLGPCEDIFSIPIEVVPLVSMPVTDGIVQPYNARGILADTYSEVTMADGSLLSDQRVTIGIKMNEFPVLPTVGDQVTLFDPFSGAVVDTFWVSNKWIDGQGGAHLQLRHFAEGPPMAMPARRELRR